MNLGFLRLLNQIKLFLLLFITATLTPIGHTQTIQGTLEHDGLLRSYRLYIPKEIQQKPAPLVMALHGRFGDGERMAYFTELDQTADKHGFLLVYPNGINGEWNYSKDIKGYPERQDDSSFLVALLDHLESEYSLDASRRYVVGLSNGGLMAQRLACDAPNHFTAFATVAAAGFGGMQEVCTKPSPISMLLMHGTHDNNILWNGITQTLNNGQKFVVAMPVVDTVTFWLTYSNCKQTYQEIVLPKKGNSPNSSVGRVSFDDCPNNKRVLLYAITGGGHNWPGVEGKIPDSIAGNTNMDIHASEEIWQFFLSIKQTID